MEVRRIGRAQRVRHPRESAKKHFLAQSAPSCIRAGGCVFERIEARISNARLLPRCIDVLLPHDARRRRAR